VRATIALAKLIRERQPRLFDYLLDNRDKQRLAAQLNVRAMQPVVHVSARYPSRLGCIAVVVPLAQHPTNRNAVVVYDLRSDPQPLLALDADSIRARLYTASADLPDGAERVPLKLVHLNRAPVIVPMGTLTPEARERWQLDEAAEERHLAAIRQAPGLAAKLAEVYGGGEPYPPQPDPDRDLYGGFLSDDDRRRCEQVRAASPDELAALHLAFDAPKLHEMLFRYRARNWPETLTGSERQRWEAFRRERLTDSQAGASIVLDEYRRRLARLAVDPSLTAHQRAVVDALIDWPGELGL
jgi:exodeoxyribonuclease-1